jgi:hypothetical protein
LFDTLDDSRKYKENDAPPHSRLDRILQARQGKLGHHLEGLYGQGFPFTYETRDGNHEVRRCTAHLETIDSPAFRARHRRLARGGPFVFVVLTSCCSSYLQGGKEYPPMEFTVQVRAATDWMKQL